MFGLARWSNRRKAALAVSLAVLMWAPTGLSEVNQPVVTGHSTFYNGKGYDPCLASIAGILKTEVRWFNDMVLVTRYGGKGTFVYITEAGAPDPTLQPALFSEGVSFDFRDPNGVNWHVEEAFMEGTAGGYSTTPEGGATVNPVREERTYVWIVELADQPITDDFAGDPRSPNYHDVYNFLVLVNTCKFHRNVDTNYNGAKYNSTTGKLDYNITHADPDELNRGYGHRDGEDPHRHESFLANIFIGIRPRIVPATQQATNVSWQSQWTVGST